MIALGLSATLVVATTIAAFTLLLVIEAGRSAAIVRFF